MDTIIDIRKWHGFSEGEGSQVVGGKGRMILGMAAAKVKVPDGIIVTTKAFDDYLYSNGLRTQNQNDNRLANIQKRLEGAAIPVYLREAVYDALERKGLIGKALVVRSSATIEDSNSASFAGIFKSFLNVSAIESIVDSIKHIYDSAFSNRVMEYMNNSQRKWQALKMAVVIQEMIHSDVSGVMFTKDPTYGGRVLVEVVLGLNDALVSGRITPSRFEIDRVSKVIVSRDVRRQKVMQIASKRSGTKLVKNRLAIEDILSDGALTEVAKVGLNLESMFGQPQDIEWTIYNNNLYILQSRAITTGQVLQKPYIQQFDGTVFTGYAASPGFARGKALRINKIADKARRGRILVFKFTNTYYLHLMRNARGIVTEEGGMLSHAAIVSRELRIPCVVGVKEAMKVIKDGAEVVLDGTRGTICLVDKGKKSVRIPESNKKYAKMVDLASLYCIDAAKRASYGSKTFYYEISDDIMTYYSDGISKATVARYVKINHLKPKEIVHGDMVKFYIIDGLPIYFRDRIVKELYEKAIDSAQKFDHRILGREFERIRLFANKEVTKAYEMKNPNSYEQCLKKFMHYRRADLAFLLADTILCEGYCVRTIYRNLEPIMDKYSIGFSDLLDKFENISSAAPLLGGLNKDENRTVKSAEKYYRVAKQWKEDAYIIYNRIGAAGDRFNNEQEKLAKRLNRMENSKNDYRKLYTAAVDRFCIGRQSSRSSTGVVTEGNPCSLSSPLGNPGRK